MLTKELLDDVERTLTDPRTGLAPFDRGTLLRAANAELNRLTALGDWDWALIYLPVVNIYIGRAYYQLPDNFGFNFAKRGKAYLCKTITGTTEVVLTYQPPREFFARTDLSVTTTGPPADYTVMTLPSGTRQIHLMPIPSAVYTLSGLYTPTDWKLQEESQLPPIPGNAEVLKDAMLVWAFETLGSQRLGFHVARYAESRLALGVKEAENRRMQFSPRMKE